MLFFFKLSVFDSKLGSDRSIEMGLNEVPGLYVAHNPRLIDSSRNVDCEQ